MAWALEETKKILSVSKVALEEIMVRVILVLLQQMVEPEKTMEPSAVHELILISGIVAAVEVEHDFRVVNMSLPPWLVIEAEMAV